MINRTVGWERGFGARNKRNVVQGYWLWETNIINNLWGQISVHLSHFSTSIFYFLKKSFFFNFFFFFLCFGFDVCFKLIIFWVCCFYSYVFFYLLNVFVISYIGHIIYPRVIGYLIPCFVVLGFWCFVCSWV
jgi:hypothetical protein